MSEPPRNQSPGAAADEREEFGELVRYTLAGYVGGLLLGGVLDQFGFHRSALGQWLVRTLSGEGESILEGLYALRQRLRRRAQGMAEAYGWGKVVGMTVPWGIDWGSRLFGLDVYGVEGFYIPYFYAMSDQIGANVSGLIFLRRRSGSWGRGVAAYVRHPVMVSGLAVILLVPTALLMARLLGFSPTTQVLTALETIIANLCWLPPAVGWWWQRK
ncbi:MAG: hypothetical protein GTN62_10105 [Gemmatimonadales bacterium]|nr:hypothetical protein [Gemmatimonadales bacterium]NIN11898.1 hypothetical protein [Gemmatimonadales bacterium]NIN50448.1 hypothetical protein [Gemmatimonadales bacterium]NIP07912.1 hypothetical protein [Gemmatimonadales bacterium]NIR01936.1 hypothetical protein [Gemmatimonadales bacterium]